jgi:hypothetical protein
MAVVHKTLWNSVKEIVLEQYKGSPKYIATIKAIVDETAQPLEDLADALKNMLDVDVAEGGWLDIVGRLVGITRNTDESDEDFRKRIKAAAVVNSAGTPDFVINVAKDLSGDEHPQYMDEAPATFFVYTGPRQVVPRGENVLTEGGQEILTEGGESVETEPVPVWEEGGRQLSRAQVSKLAPAGVLGLPGAAIETEDGLLVDPDGKLILMVADDDASPYLNDYDFVTNEGFTIVTDSGAILLGTSKRG